MNLWQKLTRWCLTQNAPEVDGQGRTHYGSAVAWRWLTLADPVEGGTRITTDRVVHTYWRRTHRRAGRRG